MSEKASPEEEKKIMRYIEIEKKYLIDTKEIILFSKLQLLMMGHPYPMKDAPGYLRRCASLIETVLNEKLLEGVGMGLSRTLLIAVLDKDGHETGRAVPVEIEYHLEVDRSYGADADGNNGISRVEYVIDSMDITGCSKGVLLKEEIVQILRDAKTEFNNLP